MDLVLDFGNTNKKLAVFKNGRLKSLEQYPTISLTIVKDFVLRHPGTESCIFSSVIRHPASVVRYLNKHFLLIELTEKTPLPINNLYRSKATLGNDRLAAAAGGASMFPGEDVLVITAGTCITYDFVNSRKEYLGGAISPGITMRLQALHTFTGKLPLISLKAGELLTGRDTEESILSGVLTGATAEIEGVMERYMAKYPGIRIILSGGDQKYFDKRLKISIFAVPNIVIHGLYQILDFNVHSSQ
jgi:type III pantothenate kinase